MLAKDSRRTLVAEEAIRCIGFRRSTHLCTIKMFPFPYRHGLWCQTSVLWPKSSPKCLQISQKGTCFKGFIDFFFFFKSLFLSLCVCLLTEETLVSRSWSYWLLWVAWSDCWGCSSDRATSNKRSGALSHHLCSPRALASKICTPMNIRMFLPTPTGRYYFFKYKINQGYLNTSHLNTKAKLSSKYLKK